MICGLQKHNSVSFQNSTPKAAPHNAARAAGERICVLMTALFAGILCVFQEKVTKSGRKLSVRCRRRIMRRCLYKIPSKPSPAAAADIAASSPVRSSPSTRTLSGLNTGSSPVRRERRTGSAASVPQSSGLSPAAVTSSTGSAISSSAALSGSSGLSAPGRSQLSPPPSRGRTGSCRCR